MKDVTNQIEFTNDYDSAIEIRKCLCGAEFKPCTFSINTNIEALIDDGTFRFSVGECPACGRKLIPIIKVFTEDDLHSD